MRGNKSVRIEFGHCNSHHRRNPQKKCTIKAAVPSPELLSKMSMYSATHLSDSRGSHQGSPILPQSVLQRLHRESAHIDIGGQVRWHLEVFLVRCVLHTIVVFSPSQPACRSATSSIPFGLPVCISVHMRAATCPMLSFVTKC